MNMAQEYMNSVYGNIKNKYYKLLGKVSVVKPIVDKLGISGIIENIATSNSKSKQRNYMKIKTGKASEVMILNRLMFPTTMENVSKWVDTDSPVGEMYKVPQGAMNDDRIAHLLDDLHPHLNTMWTEIVNTAIKKYNIQTDIIFNDLTSIYFEGDYEDSELIKYGYSRDHRPDKKQINLDINSNINGIPLVYDVLSGNIADKSTVIDNMDAVFEMVKKAPKLTKRSLIVGDRAMLDSKIMVEYHKKNNLDFLGTLKLTNELKELILSIDEEKYEFIDTDKDNGIYFGYYTDFKFTHEDQTVQNKVLVVRSEKKILTDESTREKGIKKFEMELENLKEKINKNRYKTLKSIENRIDSLRKDCSYRKYNKYIETKVREGNGTIYLEYYRKTELISESRKLDGKYIITTNRKDIPPKAMISIYKSRDICEKNFALIKGPIRVRPIFLQKDTRIESLIFLHMCALLIYNILKQLLKEKEIKISVNRVFELSRLIMVVYYEFTDGSVSRMVSDIDGNLKEIFELLNFPEPCSYIETVA